jgi:hypothetical protein
MFGNKHKRCNYEVTPPAPFPVTQVPARNLRQGMTVVAFPPGWQRVTVCCGHWPVIVDGPRYMERGAGDVPSVSWITDEPDCPGEDCGTGRSPHHWAEADLLITIAAL